MDTVKARRKRLGGQFRGEVNRHEDSIFVLIVFVQCGLVTRFPEMSPSSAARCAERVFTGEGFRMPACGDLSARNEGRRPKAPQEGTRGGPCGRLPFMGI